MGILGWALNLDFAGSGKVALGNVYNAFGYFAPGSIVTITLYDPITGNIIATDNADCGEVESTGVYIWASTNLTAQPIDYQEYAFKMTDGADVLLDQAGKIILPAPFTVSRLNAILHR